jgi:hypothetical protein
MPGENETILEKYTIYLSNPYSGSKLQRNQPDGTTIFQNENAGLNNRILQEETDAGNRW